MLLDVLHFVRNVRRSPASAVAAVVTLSLTLGAGASIFAVVDAVLLTPPPVADPGTLITAGEVPIDQPAAAPRAVNYATFAAWRERAGSLADLEAIDGTNFTLTDLGPAERISGCYATPGFLPLLGVTPALGRLLTPDDFGQRVAVVSRPFWRGKLAADPDAIGRRIVLGGQAYTVVGVLPERPSFELTTSDVWVPFSVPPAQAARSGIRVVVVGRLARNVSPAQTGFALDGVSRTSAPPARVVARPLVSALAGDAPGTVGLLASAAVLALVIAFTNLAGLLIVRSIDRRRELAVRTALGARRIDIARQVLLEAEGLVVVAVLGGVTLALWMTPVVGRLALQQFGSALNRDVLVSWRVMGAMSIVAAACAAICALAPAFLATRRSVVDGLRRGATPPPRELRLRRVFVVGEVALAFVLLLSVAFLGRSLLRVLGIRPGFDARGVLALSVSVPAGGYPTVDRVVSFYSALHTALEGRLGPRTSSVIDEIPLTGDRGRALVSVRPTDTAREVVVREAGPSYFDVMRIPLVDGRSFDPGDNMSAPLRVVLSESLAAWLFPSGQAAGRSLLLTARGQPAEIIGVVGDVKHRALDEALVPTMYLSAFQSPSRSRILVVRSAQPDADVIRVVREEVARLDRTVPMYGRRSMEDVVAASPGVPARRLLTATFLGFALLGVALGAIGLFGVAAHEVACRRSELALRIALGAEPRRILRATLGQGALMVGLGLMAGGVAAIWAVRGLRAALVATDRLDMLSVAAAAAVLVIVGAVAVLPAALRASRTDPLVALRAE